MMIRDSGLLFGPPCRVLYKCYLLTYKMSARRHLSQMHTMNYTAFYTGKRFTEKNFEANRGGRPHPPPLESSTRTFKGFAK